MHSKYHQIPGFWPEIFRSSQYWSFIIQLNLAKSESSKKMCLWKNLRNNCSLHKKCFHAFEIPPNSWFLAGNISFQSILVIYYSTQSCKIGKFKKKCLWKNLRNNCSLHKSAFMHSKYHQIPGFWPEIFRSSQYWSLIIQLNLAKSESSKKRCLWKNLRNNCSLHKNAFKHSKYHQIPGFLAGNISLQSISVIYYSTQSCKVGKF